MAGKKRGNPNFGKDVVVPDVPTRFELFTRKLGLTPENFHTSPELKNWIAKHRGSAFVPEWLLVRLYGRSVLYED